MYDLAISLDLLINGIESADFSTGGLRRSGSVRHSVGTGFEGLIKNEYMMYLVQFSEKATPWDPRGSMMCCPWGKLSKAISPYSGGVTGSKYPDNSNVGIFDSGITSNTWVERGTFQLRHSS